MASSLRVMASQSSSPRCRAVSAAPSVARTIQSSDAAGRGRRGIDVQEGSVVVLSSLDDRKCLRGYVRINTLRMLRQHVHVGRDQLVEIGVTLRGLV